MAVIDIDNPAGLEDQQVRKAVRFIVKTLNENGHPNIIMFTGNSYQVWFERKRRRVIG